MNGFLFFGMRRPGALPYRVEKFIDGEWRAMGWYAHRDEAARVIADGIGSAAKASENGFGGQCRVVATGAFQHREEWRGVA